MKNRRKNIKGTYWYKFWAEECVLCGAHDEGKYRVYIDEQPRPEERRDRYEFIQYACDTHFL